MSYETLIPSPESRYFQGCLKSFQSEVQTNISFLLFPYPSSGVVSVLRASAEREGGGARQLGGGPDQAGGAAQGGASAAGGQVWDSPLQMCSQLDTQPHIHGILFF